MANSNAPKTPIGPSMVVKDALVAGMPRLSLDNSALLGIDGAVIPVNRTPQTLGTATATLTASDNGTLRYTGTGSSASSRVTIAPGLNLSGKFSAQFMQQGSGKITLVPGAGVTVVGAPTGSTTSNGAGSLLLLQGMDANNYVASGGTLAG